MDASKECQEVCTESRVCRVIGLSIKMGFGGNSARDTVAAMLASVCRSPACGLRPFRASAMKWHSWDDA